MVSGFVPPAGWAVSSIVFNTHSVAKRPSFFRIPISFYRFSDAEDAVHDLDGKDLLGERLRVELARSRDAGGRGRRGGGFGGGRDGRDRRDNRGGGPPGPRTNYRLIVENIASRTSWQVIILLQRLPDLTNRSGPRQLFVKPGNSLNPKFYKVKKIFDVKNRNSLNPDDSLKPADTVQWIPLKRSTSDQQKLVFYNRLVSLSEIIYYIIIFWSVSLSVVFLSGIHCTS